MCYIFTLRCASGNSFRWKCWKTKTKTKRGKEENNSSSETTQMFRHPFGGRESHKNIYIKTYLHGMHGISFLLHETFANLYFAIVKFSCRCGIWNDFLFYMSVSMRMRIRVCLGFVSFKYMRNLAWRKLTHQYITHAHTHTSIDCWVR